MNLIIGTRNSKLAQWQTAFAAHALKKKFPHISTQIKPILTKGDKILDVPLTKIGGKGLFTEELEAEILSGRIDLAVHSLKDVPAILPPGLVLGAVMKRAEPGDALISPRYGTLDKLPAGARIGTSSLRRTAQLLHYRPDLTICSLRGNVDTRLHKLDEGNYDAIVLAISGLQRLGKETRITQKLPMSLCLPAVGQGALAIETRAGDTAVLSLIAALNDAPTAAAVTAERAFLSHIGGNCQIPVGVYGCINDAVITLKAVIASPDGKIAYRCSETAPQQEAVALGHFLAEKLLAEGGKSILQQLHVLTENKEE